VTSLTIVLSGSDEVSEWVRGAYDRAVALGLCTPVLWVEGGTIDDPLGRWVDGSSTLVTEELDPFSVRGGAGERRVDAPPEVRVLREAGRQVWERVRLIRFVPAGSTPSVLDPVGLYVRLLEVRPPGEGDRPGDFITTVNLLVPTEDYYDGATVAVGATMPAPWHNLVASPEDRIAGAPAVPIELDDRYVAHAMAALASVGTWTAMTSSPFDDAETEVGGEDVVQLIRTRSRTVAAPSAADRVAGRALRYLPPDRLPFTGEQIHPVSDGPAALANHAAKQLLAYCEGDLLFREPTHLRGGRPMYIGLLGLLRYLWDWMRRAIRRELVDLAMNTTDRVREAVDKKVQNALLGGDDSILRLKVFAGNQEGTDVPEDHDPLSENLNDVFGADLPTQWDYSSPAHVWEALRSVGFALIDGGQTVVELQPEFRGGKLPAVIRDPHHVVGGAVVPTEFRARWPIIADLIGFPKHAVPSWDLRWIRGCIEQIEDIIRPPKDAEPVELEDEIPTEARDYLRSLEELGEQSFLGRVSKLMLDEVGKSRDRFRWCLAKAAEAHALAMGFKSGKRKRRLIWACVGTVLVVAAIVAFALFGPLAGAAVTALIVVAVGGGIVRLFLKIVGYFRDKFIVEHHLDKDETDYSYANRVRLDILRSMKQLSASYTVFRDWGEIIASEVRGPFGPPVQTPPRLWSPQVPDLRSHQIGQGEFGRDAFVGISEQMARREFQAGWLGRAYEAAAEESARRFRRRTGVEGEDAADPDRDGLHASGTGDPIRDLSPRLFLRREMFEDDADSIRFRCRVGAYERVISELAEIDPDRYLTHVQGVDIPEGDHAISTWLLRIQAAQPDEFLLSVWSGPDRKPVAGSILWLPPALAPTVTEALTAFRDPRFLVYQSLVVEWSEPFLASRLKVLAPGPAAVVETSTVAPKRWHRPEQVPRLDDLEIQRRRARSLEAGGPLAPNALIEPAAAVIEPTESASFRFLDLVDGEPLRFKPGSTLPFVVRDIGAPEDGLAVVRACLQRVADATGYRFRFQGIVSDFPGWEYGSAPKGDEVYPLWIGWVFDDEEPAFASNEAVGMGGPRSLRPHMGSPYLHTGLATVRAEFDLKPGFGAGTVGKVLLHELGHLMNLGHVDDPAQIMCQGGNPQTPQGYGDGDLYGLWTVGASGPS
jgi:hypothetical protein